jgi:hypothetical protein
MELLGLARVFHRDEAPGPTFHIAASSTTGLLLSIYPEQHGDSTRSCIVNTLSQLQPARLGQQPNLTGKTVALDRGYNSRSIVKLLDSYGADVVGTVSTNQGSSFSTENKPDTFHVEEDGIKSAYWVTSQINSTSHTTAGCQII